MNVLVVDDAVVVVVVVAVVPVVAVIVVLVAVEVVVVAVVVVLLVHAPHSTGHKFLVSSPNGGGSEQLPGVSWLHLPGSTFPLQFTAVVVVVADVV